MKKCIYLLMQHTEPIILRLPIKSLETTVSSLNSFEKKDYKYDPVIKELEAYDSNSSNFAFIKNPKKQNLPKKSSDGESVIYNSFPTMIDPSDLTSYPSRTDIACWWCCHKFNNPPVPLPEYQKNGVIHINGCFCSVNCAMAYNYSLKDKDINNRESLLRLIVKKMYPEIPITSKIIPSPSNKVLKKFGGVLSIEEYRENNINVKKNYKFINPPVMFLLPQIHAIHARQMYMVNKTKNILKNRSFIPLNMNEVDSALKNIKIKDQNRAANCLEVTMGISFTDKK